eukprot:Em0005g953a
MEAVQGLRRRDSSGKRGLTLHCCISITEGVKINDLQKSIVTGLLYAHIDFEVIWTFLAGSYLDFEPLGVLCLVTSARSKESKTEDTEQQDSLAASEVSSWTGLSSSTNRGCGSTTLTLHLSPKQQAVNRGVFGLECTWTPKIHFSVFKSIILCNLSDLLPMFPLMGVAVSMGSMLMIKYITECNHRGLRCPVKAAMLISVPWTLPIAERNMNKTFNRLTLNRHLCKQFRDILRNNETLFRQHSERGWLCFDFGKALPPSLNN